MRCEKCDKNEATVHLTEIVSNEVHEFHLCEDCAKVKSGEMEQNFGLADLLAGLSTSSKTPSPEDIACQNCGLRYSDFRKSGRLGCNQCYHSFKGEMTTLLKKIHGSAQHHGKKPVSSTSAEPVDGILKLKAELKAAIEAEQFEKAVEIRDQLKSLEKGS